jgi:uncharacterized cupredoxin-like copper-binding protein
MSRVHAQSSPRFSGSPVSIAGTIGSVSRSVDKGDVMRLPAVVTTMTLLLAACGAAAPTSVPPGTSRTVRIDMSDFFFSPTTVNLNPGETVTLVLKNFGTLEHEFMAGRDAIYGQGYDDDWLAKAKPGSSAGHDMRHMGESVRIAPNSTVTITLVVPAGVGQFEFGRFVPGHYEAGMKGILLVGTAVGAPSATTAPRTSPPAPMPSGMPMTNMGGDDEGH